MTTVMNMKDTVARAKAEGINISLYGLRKLVAMNLIPHRRIDRIVLIPWDGFCNWVSCKDFEETKPEPVTNGIRRLR